jgi:hypothetical protein
MLSDCGNAPGAFLQFLRKGDFTYVCPASFAGAKSAGFFGIRG